MPVRSLNELVIKIAMQDCGQASHLIIKSGMPLLCENINNTSTKSRVLVECANCISVAIISQVLMNSLSA